ncbi:MAG: hypothetical protein V2A77_04885 [Pseudomonadota bacterium]
MARMSPRDAKVGIVAGTVLKVAASVVVFLIYIGLPALGRFDAKATTHLAMYLLFSGVLAGGLGGYAVECLIHGLSGEYLTKHRRGAFIGCTLGLVAFSPVILGLGMETMTSSDYILRSSWTGLHWWLMILGLWFFSIGSQTICVFLAAFLGLLLGALAEGLARNRGRFGMVGLLLAGGVMLWFLFLHDQNTLAFLFGRPDGGLAYRLRLGNNHQVGSVGALVSLVGVTAVMSLTAAAGFMGLLLGAMTDLVTRRHEQPRP